ncbi:MAG: NADPH-dependent 7-cyano-7-deazaguanine reductase [Candidatus Sericytochromatia bacterium]|nr:MAG: NADPH-dependent 7-cyano-7-deazaguanine reductase [Candidatus Sericytochromatia bacterium]
MYDNLKSLGNKVSIPDNPDKTILETFDNPSQHRKYTIVFNCPEFTHICPVTGQPDFAKITINYVPDKKCIESKSLKLYLGSFRNHGSFHEAVTNRILDDIVKVAEPFEAKVIGNFNARGGISIDVIAEFKR